MKNSLPAICLLTALVSIVLAAPAMSSTDLFFSEYIEGSSYNKAVEIYNCTGADVDLTAYELALYSNGSATATSTVTLSRTLASGDVFVVAHTSFSQPDLADMLSGTINFNGDDAFALRRAADASLVDVIGQIGFRPVPAWGTAPTTTINATLRRKASVCDGDTDGSDAFDPAIEWDGFAQDALDGLGAHLSDCGCGPVQIAPATWGQMKSLYR